MNSSATSMPDRSYWTPTRLRIWIALAIVIPIFQAPLFVRFMRPPVGSFTDFCQEWLSAKNWLTGRPVYSPQLESLFLHTGLRPLQPKKLLPWNAHPPASIVIALPFGLLDYPDANLLWNIISIPMFLLSIWIILRERNIPLRPASVFPAIALLAFCAPLLLHLFFGQTSILLLFLTTVAWRADRRERLFLAGMLVGLATALKLSPGFLFICWIGKGRRIALVGGAFSFFVSNLVALAFFGTEAFTTYIDRVIPSNTLYWSSYANVSLSGLWLKLFDPDPLNDVLPLFHSPILAKALVILSQLTVALLTGYRCWQARSRQQRDSALALAIVGMLIINPLTWNHYFVLLALPVAVVWSTPLRGFPLLLRRIAFVIIWVPNFWFLYLVFSSRTLNAWISGRGDLVIQPWITLLITNFPTYALLALFYLCWIAFPATAEASDASNEHAQ